MNAKRILGIVILIGGIAMMLFSQYIKNRVAEGKGQIEGAQRTVDQTNSLLSQNSAAKKVGQATLTNPAQKKIDEGKMQVAQYTALAKWLQVGGVILVIAGGFVIFTGGRKKK